MVVLQDSNVESNIFCSSTGIFPITQPVYAAHGVPTFPVDGSKKPMVRGYHRIGHRFSNSLASNPRFANADGIGFVTGRSSQVTIVDIDSSSDRELTKALDRHGSTPLIARTPSGGHHLYYRHNGERRQIRPFRGIPIDVLGNGLAILPPSISRKGQYQFIQGTIADLDRLPSIIHHEQEQRRVAQDRSTVGRRNSDLWRYCMKAARSCDTYDDLLDVARTFNDELNDPLEHKEVVKVATSAWRYEESGQNFFGQHGAFFATNEAMRLIRTDQDAFVLLGFLRANNRPEATFMCANGLDEVLGWTVKRVAAARNHLIRSGHIVMVRKPSSGGGPAFYRGGNRAERESRGAKCR